MLDACSRAAAHGLRVGLLALPAAALAALTLLPLTLPRAGIAAERPVAPNTIGTALSASLPVTFAADNNAHTLGEISGKNATVLVFLGTECPIAMRYQPEIAAIGREYFSKGVRVIAVFPNAGETRAAAMKYARMGPLRGLPLIMDGEQKLTDLVGATVTPEAVLLDSERTIRYRGRIDDLFAERGKPSATGAKTRDLRLALETLLTGKAVKAATIPAVGCLIERKPMTVAATGPTYTGQVASILNKNCVSCHRKGEIGPMPFTTYEEAKKYAANIVSVTETRLMPPWKPVKGHGDFADERRLSESEIKALKEWAESGAPFGRPAEMPSAPSFTDGWQLGTPDLVLKMPQSYRVSETTPDIYRCFVLPTGLTEDKEVVAVEYRAGNKSIVHHVLGYIDVNGAGREKDAGDEGFGYTSFGGPGFLPYGELGGWAPGNMPRFLPNGVGRKLPAGSDIVMQVHYHANGKSEEDQTEVGLYFARKPVEKQFRVAPVVVRKLEIPAGEANHTVTATYPIPLDATVYQVTPHMHLLGRKIEMQATLPDGKVVPLIRIDDWDFKWQDSYVFKEPVKLPKGATVTLTASYDNSMSNPRNPNNPPQTVTWGEATTDEMCIGFLGFTADNENDPLLKLMERLRQRRGQNNAESERTLRTMIREFFQGTSAGKLKEQK